MPSEKILQEKQQFVNELSDKLSKSVAGVLVSYQGISVADDTKLRTELRNADVEYAVVKNTLLLLAAQKAGLVGLDDVLKGTTALATSTEDYVAAAKILTKYAGTSKTFKVKAGFVDGGIIDETEVASLAKLPSKEVLVAKALGGLNAPITGLVYVLQANITGLARVLGAIAEKQSA